MSYTTLVSAKDIYLDQLNKIVCPVLHKHFMQIYNDAVIQMKQNKKQSPLELFQGKLQEIGAWDESMIHARVQELLESNSKTDAILIAVFHTYTKILLQSRRINRASIEITIPTIQSFLLDCYRSSARAFWTSPELFVTDKLHSIEIQSNFRARVDTLKESIKDTIHDLLPIRDIVNDYAHEDSDSETSDTDLVDSDAGVSDSDPEPDSETKVPEPEPESEKVTPVLFDDAEDLS